MREVSLELSPVHVGASGKVAVLQAFRCVFFVLGILVCTAMIYDPPYCRAQSQAVEARGYIGSLACMPCHKAEYERFSKFARKAQSYGHVMQMKKGLSPEELKECYGCHTTGYGKIGGFVSMEQTPDLKDAGCEVCHGPGRLHVETQDASHIQRKVSIELCQTCHTNDRVGVFRYSPVLHGGAH